MTDFDLVVRSDRVLTPDGERPAAVGVRDGRIAAVTARGAALDTRRDEDLGDVALLPGLVDTHVHVNEPGRTEWEGFATATAAAAAGGVTTLIDMPLNSLPSTVSAEALAVKRAAAAGRCVIDVGFWGGAIPGNLADLRDLHEAGVFGFKCFLSPSGVDEFPPLDWDELDEVLAELSAFDGLLIVHAEDADELAAAPPAGPSYREFLASRPDAAEGRAVDGLLARAAATGNRVHVLHLSSATALGALAAARADGVRVTAETCPHYLTLAAESIADGATEFKCCPPIRGAANRDRLWEGLAGGVIDCVVSDHSPSTPDLKHGGFGEAWGGISSLQLGLPAVWTAAADRGHPLADVVRWMASAPADLVGLRHKGRIAVGADADLVAFADGEEFTVEPAELRHRHPLTPYAGARLRGVVRRTWLRGRESDGEPAGRLLHRKESR
ncbi:allantoinase AllB [Amycolatopsis suaedae]|uniref:allantoinase n=1 Tax=Amycolatopsis suaedae TaxID=2510978 RepID=A0A4Q7JAJ9_9PSEU|nr:allantoinase AllB [Amycolatopsis suaedae]RZQ63962.1 allantoinase AllB [Amycolatopsis suaedae]